MREVILFLLLSIPVIAVSLKSIRNPKSHGFYRFFAWECILWLFVQNYSYWFATPLEINQFVSWILLIVAAYIVIAGAVKLKSSGKSDNSRKNDELYKFEKTTKLVDTGIYKYIRHPLYASLIFLTWGIFLKHPRLSLFIVSAASTILLYFTARRDEKECMVYFGDDYKNYMTRSKMFIPHII